jgi:hypothetical protein
MMGWGSAAVLVLLLLPAVVLLLLLTMAELAREQLSRAGSCNRDVFIRVLSSLNSSTQSEEGQGAAPSSAFMLGPGPLTGQQHANHKQTGCKEGTAQQFHPAMCRSTSTWQLPAHLNTQQPLQEAPSWGSCNNRLP